METGSKKESFEELLTRLDAIVRQLEKGETSLADSLALYEEGTKLLKKCTKLLDTAEQKVTRLQVSSEPPVELPFDKDDE